MTRAFVVLAGLTCVAAVPAFAEPLKMPAALGRAQGIYTPRAGDYEFFLTGPAFPIGATTAQGVGVSIGTGDNATTTTSLGLTAGLGFATTDLVEIGGAIGFVYVSQSQGNQSGNDVTLNIEPFLKVNFGSGMAKDSRINPFALAAVALGYQSQPSSALFSIELAGGAEFMLTHTWGISLYVPFTVQIPTASGSTAKIGIGLGYGLVAYFD